MPHFHIDYSINISTIVSLGITILGAAYASYRATVRRIEARLKSHDKRIARTEYCLGLRTEV